MVIRIVRNRGWCEPEREHAILGQKLIEHFDIGCGSSFRLWKHAREFVLAERPAVEADGAALFHETPVARNGRMIDHFSDLRVEKGERKSSRLAAQDAGATQRSVQAKMLKVIIIPVL